ncbi:RNB domain-containing ribonuclease [Streptacidiphilus cavernicola]|uniref:RNB domain-containing ribonuclease n=1 Tax=Streptacidiphilus cavernicola TaxID=3342716 RepID=A0ABV6W5Q4_9ACTN
MPRRHLSVRTAGTARIDSELAELRARLELPESWSPEVLAEVEEVARSPRLPSYDATDLPLFTLDPPESMDLDQAMHLERRGSGYRVYYAIADVGAFVRPGGAIDAEARRRVETLYFPDLRVPLHPPQLSEGAASLLPDQDAPALLWQLDLDVDGELIGADLRRALVRSRRKLDYASVQRDIDEGRADKALALLGIIGPLREEREADRGGVSLPLPEQEIEPVDGGYALNYRAPRPADGWNAQISLLTGMAAAEMMLDAGVGLLRTLPGAPAAAYARLRRTATALGVDWPADLPYPKLIRSLNPARPAHAAFLNECTGLLRGAAYTAFDDASPGLGAGVDPAAGTAVPGRASGTGPTSGSVPASAPGSASAPAPASGSATVPVPASAPAFAFAPAPGTGTDPAPAAADAARRAALGHAAVAAPYAHCTAPLRRLADRFAGEVCAAVASGDPVPDWVREALPEIPKLMETGDRRAHEVERVCVDLVEAELLHGREGEVFDGVVVDVDERKPQSGTVQLHAPAVRARLTDDRPDAAPLPLGTRLRVRLTTADPVKPTVRFAPA